MENKRNILLCVAGGTPAIITETLWALMQKNERVDEILVITTSEGREKMLTGKLNGRGAPDESLLDEKEGRFYKFQEHFPDYAKNIKFQSSKSFYILTKKNTGVPNLRDDESDWLGDILTDEDNEKIANQICETVREICSDENVKVHASIAGGRKTMSLYLMTAMQLFGRKDDVMSHVLVSKEVEFGAPKFFYKTPKAEAILDPAGKEKKKDDESILTTEDINIYLAEIPFIRLRGVGSELLNQRFISYAEIVAQAQEQLEKNKLVFNLADGTFKVGNRDGSTLDKGKTLTERDYFVFVMFAWLCWRKSGYLEVTEISLRDFDQICRIYSKAKGQERGCDAFLLRGDALDKLNFQFFRKRRPSKSFDYALFEVKATLQDAISTIKTHLKKCGISENYAIKNHRKYQKNVQPLYGLEVEPSQIEFV